MKQGISAPHINGNPRTDFRELLGATAKTALRNHWVVLVFLAGMVFLASFSG